MRKPSAWSSSTARSITRIDADDLAVEPPAHHRTAVDVAVEDMTPDRDDVAAAK